MQEPIQQFGSNFYVQIPKWAVEKMGLCPDMMAEVRVEGETLMISKAQMKHRSFEERWAGFEGNVACEELDSGMPVGREVL